ncbi:uncharacterized protein LACBIDRAFT_324576 [Laccaria bicolor S238N-H82]|uniref:Predicted protein n=1 Tax=Laccaria bicolor (strain S238N-H82 / ATCC MYA-4686) TaxID=486041 RepID=B0D2C6_LACBS|nr:uncharacterized protein LACBIDRAFT_324576 [Laccaria bicolor S238N-H82]EDR10723.1 predicted protein [Laccaria bicolor S238N-H82]|eukprot:XP_001878024.1 predicted protein [Laccaria bicolor S238N-H82]
MTLTYPHRFAFTLSEDFKRQTVLRPAPLLRQGLYEAAFWIASNCMPSPEKRSFDHLYESSGYYASLAATVNNDEQGRIHTGLGRLNMALFQEPRDLLAAGLRHQYNKAQTFESGVVDDTTKALASSTNTWFQSYTLLVFESPVRSGFLMPRGVNRNRNRSAFSPEVKRPDWTAKRPQTALQNEPKNVKFR